ncbi:putative cytosol aminopeptidase [Frankliniella fusca]|uniref:Cytosol aminopeptidase n=1 Tax=Frankliniella fusca TaxID=407009 RepID=A0AAE1HH08_9NEOP|nr:putative cytosol aminopeptidase [Frankliniella fusca]
MLLWLCCCTLADFSLCLFALAAALSMNVLVAVGFKSYIGWIQDLLQPGNLVVAVPCCYTLPDLLNAYRIGMLGAAVSADPVKKVLVAVGSKKCFELVQELLQPGELVNEMVYCGFGVVHGLISSQSLSHWLQPEHGMLGAAVSVGSVIVATVVVYLVVLFLILIAWGVAVCADVFMGLCVALLFILFFGRVEDMFELWQ